MAIGPKFKLLSIILMFTCIFIITPRFANAQLVVYLDSVTATNQSDSIPINVYIDNYSGVKITGYTLFIKLKYGDFIGFFSDSVQLIDTTYENCVEDSCIVWNQDSTVCQLYTCLSYADTLIDSSWVQRGAVDTSLSLTSGWDFLDVSILDVENRSVKVNAIANQGSNPAGIPSPTAHGLLCRLFAGVKPYDSFDSCEVIQADTLAQLPWAECFCDSLIAVEFDTVQTRFTDSTGEFIGWSWSDTAYTCVSAQPPDTGRVCVRRCVKPELTDTGYIYHCLDSACFYEYNGSCYLWECTDCNKWDSSGYVDPDSVLFSHGQIEVTCPEYLCGDANGDGGVNVSDAVYIINFVFIGGAAPNPLASGNANCDTGVNVSDAVYIINYVFVGGTFPCDINGDGVPDC
jgi:hypothetical protein